MIFSLAISGTNIFAGTSKGGIFLSTNNGGSWFQVNEGLPSNIYINALAISGDTIFAGTIGEGVWKRPLSEMLGINEILNPKSQILISIFPNPVNSMLTVTYYISENSQLNLSIYDLTGRKLATLLNDFKPKGDYTLEYNAEDLKSGLYFLKATTNTTLSVSKFIKE